MQTGNNPVAPCKKSNYREKKCCVKNSSEEKVPSLICVTWLYMNERICLSVQVPGKRAHHPSWGSRTGLGPWR